MLCFDKRSSLFFKIIFQSLQLILHSENGHTTGTYSLYSALKDYIYSGELLFSGLCHITMETRLDFFTYLRCQQGNNVLHDM